VGFEPKISVGKRPQTYALDRAATETGKGHNIDRRITSILSIPVQNLKKKNI
jgi:hypothetical protein